MQDIPGIFYGTLLQRLDALFLPGFLKRLIRSRLMATRRRKLASSERYLAWGSLHVCVCACSLDLALSSCPRLLSRWMYSRLTLVSRMCCTCPQLEHRLLASWGRRAAWLPNARLRPAEVQAAHQL